MKLTKPASPALSSKKPFPVRLGWMVALALIAGITIGAVGTWLLAEQVDQLRTTMTKSSTQESFVVPPVSEAEVSVSPEEVEEIAELENVMPSEVRKAYAEARAFASSDAAIGDVRVDWIEPEDVTSTRWGELFGGVATQEAIEKFSKMPEEEGLWMSVIKKLGTVKEGMYEGATVYGAGLEANYPFFGGPSMGIFMRTKDGSKVFLDVSDTLVEETFKDFGIHIAGDVSLKGAHIPSYLTVQGQKFVPAASQSLGYVFGPYSYFSVNNTIEFVANSEEGYALYKQKIVSTHSSTSADLYGESGCLYVFLSNGFWVKYTTFLPAFMDVHENEIGAVIRNPNIAWAKGFENNNLYYGATVGGCGALPCPAIVNLSPEDESELVQIGIEKKTREAIYGPKDYVSWKGTAHIYDTWYVASETKPSLEEMVKKYTVPFFFWKDALGRWNQYKVEGLIPAVECGKPVIYLYPEKKTDVRVSLPKSINVTVSDPTYPSKGWVVTANPNGDLVSHADGKTYGSLFWEGTGVSYQTPTTGFVVKREDVGSFLASTLPKYGLNQKESQEFMDFWVPRMASSSYYQVSFLTDTWSKAAPLNVFPRPKTSIRIFMDLKPLSAPISIKAPTIITPKRDGFTLVEWGGLLY
ncbi:MAG: hypothetical protein KIH65_002265 [Candidatus Uhrbacteria bacterium]|nr:hypothetical protein [Candidatus Uhrbacteria bacterium]